MMRHNIGSVTGIVLGFAACLAAAPSAGWAASEKPIYAFGGGRDGYLPNAPLLRVGGTFYGTTNGGMHGHGMIYSVDTAGSLKVLYNFKGVLDGSGPVGGLVELGGTLYGVTSGGGMIGNGGAGTVFSMTPHGAYKQLYVFKGAPTDGYAPQQGLVVLGNFLYGTTGGGGPSGDGTVFSITPQGSESVLYTFQGNSDGSHPNSIITDGTTLYGTTEEGAGKDCQDGCGTVFTIDPQGAEKTLYKFGNGDGGGNPSGSLVKVGNTLYGATARGGSNDFGTVFSLSPTGDYTDLHDFSGADGGAPESLIATGGTLYGTTYVDQNSNGTVFSMTKSGALTTLYSFQGGTDGFAPGALLAVKGILYGTTRGLGSFKCYKADPPDCGTVFALTP